MAVSHAFVPRDPDDAGKLLELLDPDNPMPNLSVDRFNVYWNRLDADAEFVSLMNDLYQRAGINREYKPIQMPEGEETPNLIKITDLTVLGHKGQVLQGSDLDVKEPSDLIFDPSPRKVSINKDLLLRTMRTEGLV